MTEPLRPDVVEANRQQRMAADPRETRLASANAGSGKTRVLVSRVSRILLGGVKPDKILCLTYTKAAASEMQTRLFKTLGSWSVMSDEELAKALTDILGETHKSSSAKLRQARELFAKALETPEGLKVQTIHAFCDRILSRFPIEAGILPGFEPMDDTDVIAAREHVQEQIFKECYRAPESELADALRCLSAEKTNIGLEPLFQWMGGRAQAIEDWKAGGGLHILANNLGLAPIRSLEEIKIGAWNNSPKTDLSRAADGMLASGKPKEIMGGETIKRALAEDDPFSAWDIYAGLVMKADLTPTVQICSKAAGPAALAVFDTWNKSDTPEMRRLFDVGEAIKSAICLEFTQAVFVIAQRYQELYQSLKGSRRWLDFDDQVTRVSNLLTQSSVSEWVKYKLDGGIDHILVDEAQDTSPSQWDIIDALKENFGTEDVEKPKTFFAVGDEKQSIYSFQGAKPERFIEKSQQYLTTPNAAAIQMKMSFRSSPDVLRVVDAVFDDQRAIERMFDPDKVPFAGDKVVHTAHRTDPGLVEFWPLAPRPEKEPDKEAWDTTPVDSNQASSREYLAATIAKTVKTWLDTKEPVFDRDMRGTRPMQAGDILILVRSRNDFFDAIIRNLKKENVPVAGADRLVLKDAMVVKDLLALTRFVLCPSDDLSLAEVLRSPFFDISEDELFKVAYGRGKTSLGQSLTYTHPNASAQLDKIITWSRRWPPYEFYMRVLDLLSGGESFLKKVYGRLGIEAKDALEAFLNRALNHQRRRAPSLQHFLRDFEKDNQDVRRDLDGGSGEARVMTVHGAKGLEAPVVFLPDTTQIPTGKNDSGLVPFENGFVYLPKKDLTPSHLKPAREEIAKADMRENLRLLYVAMTRAESRLIVCGYELGNKKGGFAPCSWYEEVSQAFDGLNTDLLPTQFGDGRMYGQLAVLSSDKARIETDGATELPSWVVEPAQDETISARHLTPSHLLGQSHYEPAVRSPLSQSPDRFRRGNIIHKLLEILPDTELDNRETTARRYLDSYSDLSAAHRDQIFDEVSAVLDHPDYQMIFAPGSHSEISLAGQAQSLTDNLYLSGQIDRLAVTEDSVFIIDYKSNRPPPQKQDDVPDIYWGQMAAYREMIRDIYPDKEIKCGLLWTDGPRLMLLDDEGLDRALTMIESVLT